MNGFWRAGLMTLMATFCANTADAHGLWGHIHVTGWAVENMPEGDLKTFFDEPEVFNALLFGSVFTDSGYALSSDASREYSEHTHWEPFIDEFITWIQVNDPPPWTSMESKKRVAFLMGCASHGLQDSIFDSLFLAHAEEHDNTTQASVDPATDGFLFMDEHIRFVPEKDIPIDTLLELYADLSSEITEDVILESVALVTDVYINDGPGMKLAAAMGQLYEDDLPWTRTHYLDPEVPGSLRSEIFPTMHHQQAIWERLHQEFDPDAVTIATFPEFPRRLSSANHTSPQSWITLIFGEGVHYEQGLLTMTDQTGAAVPFTQGNTQWGAEWTRLLRLFPEADLTPGAWYTVSLQPGTSLIGGQTSQTAYSFDFQVACDADNADECEPLDDLPVASIDGESGEDTGIANETDSGCSCSSAPRPRPQLILLWVSLMAFAQRRRTSTNPVQCAYRR